ncbi:MULTISPECIES: helix-turn-helix domain-containing protein [unclassified Frankia]|uniref:helix-turn-helix domain-containing protein n=1 Tax=unclassified Frankia TaxID=2632575 RepID=UPI001EF7509E|nr:MULTISPECIES: helix-turn-helix domain-containing protein [unclassified Frankia]
MKIEERETVSRELSRHKSARYIGQLLGRHHSTISREIDRNGGATAYRAVEEPREAAMTESRVEEIVRRVLRESA